MTMRGTILVVDDQIEMLAGIQLTLETAGYRVLTVCDGHLALEQLQRESVDLILADIAMPQMNGYQLYEHIRNDPHLVRIPFLFLTARAMASDIRYGKALGVDDYLIKPIKPEDLLAAVEGRLRRARDLAQAAMPDRMEASIAEKPSAYRTLTVGALRIAPEQHRTWFGDQEIRMSAREFRVLEHLAQQSGNVVLLQELVRISHGLNVDPVEAGALIRPLIRMLRRRLGYAGGETGCIENVRGIGYRLNPPESPPWS